MDPVSAFALACNILQVVELCLGAAQACKEIYEAGSLRAHDEIDGRATDLRCANTELRNQLGAVTLSPGDARVKRLATEVGDTATEIATIVGQLRLVGKQNAGRALMQALKALSKRRPIEKLTEKLEKQERLLNSVILKELYVRCCRANIKLETIETLNDYQNAILHRLETKLEQNHRAVIRQTQTSEQNVVLEVRDAKTHSDHVHSVSNLLQTLAFPEMTRRQNMVQQRVGNYGTTYDWVFDSDRGRHSIFADWLRGQDKDGMFWITGKPGSGKSSLLNHIFINLRDVEFDHLPKSSDRMVLTHFFYRSNDTELQTSLEGFLRTTCHQMLAADPSLVGNIGHALASSQKAQFHSRLSGLTSSTPWLLHDLEHLCQHLLRATIVKKTVYLLVDGIDEMIDEQQESFVGFLQKLDAELLPLRVCCSARAEAHLKSLLNRCKSFRLDDLNREDMKDYCSRTLAGTPMIKFIPELVRRSEGVFLWLYIVTTDMKRNWKYESEEELEARLIACPKGISALFSHMLSRFEPYHLKPKPMLAYIYRFQQISRTSKPWLDTLELLLATQFFSELQGSVLDKIDPVFVKRVGQMCKHGNEQITAHSGGLVGVEDWRSWFPDSTCYQRCQYLENQMSGDETRDAILLASVQDWNYIHTTVRDFLEDAFSTSSCANLVQLPLVKIYRHGMRSRIAAIKIRHWLLPDLFAQRAISGCLELSAVRRIITDCREIVNQLSVTPDGMQTADEILSEVTSAILHCCRDSLVHKDEARNLLVQISPEGTLVGGVEAQSQLYCLAAFGSNLRYALSRISHVQTSDRLAVAAVLFIWCFQSTASFGLDLGELVDNIHLILDTYDVMNQRVSLLEGLSSIVSEQRDVTPWLFMVRQLWQTRWAWPFSQKSLVSQLLQLCLDRGAPDKLDIELSIFIFMGHKNSSYSSNVIPFHDVRIANRVDDLALYLNRSENLSMIDIVCRIPSVKRLAEKLCCADAESNAASDWDDILQLSVARIRPLGAGRSIALSGHGPPLLHAWATKRLRQPRFSYDLSGEEFIQYQKAECCTLLDYSDEFSLAEKITINRLWADRGWALEVFAVDEVTTEDDAESSDSEDA